MAQKRTFSLIHMLYISSSLQYFKGQEQEPLTYPEEKEQVEEPRISMNVLDLEEAAQDMNLTGNSDYPGSRASTLSDTIIRPLDGQHVQMVRV